MSYFPKQTGAGGAAEYGPTGSTVVVNVGGEAKRRQRCCRWSTCALVT
jgi:hypothetical protein